MKDASKAFVISRLNGEHYAWGMDCDGWHLVKDSSLSIIEECMPPGTAELWHYHRKAQQFFFVLSGRAVMEVEGDVVELACGDGVRVLAGQRHQIRNESNEPVRFLVISQPPSHGDRITDLCPELAGSDFPATFGENTCPNPTIRRQIPYVPPKEPDSSSS